MEDLVKVSYPKRLALSLKMNDYEFVDEMKKLSVIKLYEIGKISSTIAAKTLGIKRIDFLELINSYQVSYFSHFSEKEIVNDIENA